VNLDPRHTQSGWVDFDRAPGDTYELRNFVQLDPPTLPAQPFGATRK
jgi:hypothetical protein